MHRAAAAKPRVFISSVVEGFGEFRAAARAAVLEAGGEPILVNEDFPSLAASSRNACLDAVESSDIYVGILGTRGGWVAPSGMLVVEEEWRHAWARKRPTLFFLQSGARDADAERLASAISDYVDGTLRRTFTTAEDLRREMVRGLSPLITSQGNMNIPPEELLKAFAAGSQFSSSEPSLRVVIAPERQEEVVDPVRMGSEVFRRKLMEIGHRAEVNLLDYGAGTTTEVKRDLLILKQSPVSTRSGAGALLVGFSERAVVTAELVATESSQSDGMSFMHSSVLSAERVGELLRRVIAFYAATIHDLDPYRRYQTFHYHVALEHLGHWSLLRNPQPRSSYSLNMRGGNQPVLAYPEPRLISRQDLSDPSAEIERVLTLLMRNSSA